MSNRQSLFLVGAIIGAILAFYVPMLAEVFYSAMLIFGISTLIGVREKLDDLRHERNVAANASPAGQQPL